MARPRSLVDKQLVHPFPARPSHQAKMDERHKIGFPADHHPPAVTSQTSLRYVVVLGCWSYIWFEDLLARIVSQLPPTQIPYPRSLASLFFFFLSLSPSLSFAVAVGTASQFSPPPPPRSNVVAAKEVVGGRKDVRL
jgi:hypothetical protein